MIQATVVRRLLTTAAILLSHAWNLTIRIYGKEGNH